MTEEEIKRKEENKRIFENQRNEINKRDLSNSESFDKALLSLSSAGLALSLTFIKFVIPLEDITCIIPLYITWVLFGLTIILVIISILISQKALHNSLIYAEKYYLDDDEDYYNKQDNWSRINKYLPITQSITFILAIISVIIFATINFEKSKDLKMSEKQTKSTTFANGVPVPSMQKIEKRGLDVPSMQKKPTPPPSNTTPKSNSEK